MELNRWKQIERLYYEALEREPGARDAFLDEACAGDEDLRREVARLLACDVPSDSFMQSPAIEIAARALAAEQPIETSTNPTGSLVAGSQIGAYQLLGPLGRGGMAEVHLALDTRLGRKVAVKLLPAEFTTDTGRVRRFAREARAASALNHPNIITIHEIGEVRTGAGATHYIVTEFVEGETLRQRMTNMPQGRLSLAEALDVAAQIAAALATAHKAGITHRDIKPENVMARRDGIVKVLDFGLAKLTEERQVGKETERQGDDSLGSPSPPLSLSSIGAVMGTPRYMSPEQARGDRVDARTDIFSLGVMLFEMIAGRPPFAGAAPNETIAAILRDSPPPLAECAPDAPPEMERILTRALRKNREERYQTVSEMLADLQRLKGGLAQSGFVASSESLGARSYFRFTSRVFSPLGHSRRTRAFIGILFAGLLLGIWGIRPWLTAESYAPSPQAKRFYLEGVNSLRDGSYYKAKGAFAQVIDIDGQHAIPHARLAESWMELDYTDKANAELVLANTLRSSHMADMDKLYIDALNLTASSNFSGAVEKYRKLVSTASDDDKTYAYVDLGRAYERNEDLETARQNYSEAIKLWPQNAAAYLRLGALHVRQQQFSLAQEAFDKAEAIYRTLSNHEGVTEVNFQRGALSNHLGKLDEARNLLEKALDDSNSAYNKYQHIKVKCLLELSKVASVGGRTEEAKKLATKAIESAEADGIENLATAGLIDLGHAFFKQRAYEEAERYFQKALDIARKDKGRRNEARANLSLGSLYVQTGKIDEGLPLLEDARRFYQNGGYRKDDSQCLLFQGRAKLLKGDYDAAVKILDQQLVTARQIENPSQIAQTQIEIASAFGRHDLLPQALRLYEESLNIYKQLGNKFYQCYCLLNHADLLSRLGQYEESREDLNQLSVLLTGLDNNNKYKHSWRIWIHILNARLALGEGNCHLAISEGRDAFKLAKSPPYQLERVDALSILGLAQTCSGDFRDGLETCRRARSLAKLTNNQRQISEVTLALARAEFESGALRDALANALTAQEFFSRNRQSEYEWQAWRIAGQVNKWLGKGNDSAEQFVRANQSLLTLKQNWGEKAFNTYMGRSDLRPLHDSIKEALRNSTKP
jgi:serine/threonine protein kinase/Flp pilus assembly protein TadD